MADYNIPTLEDVDETKKNMDSITEFIESTEDTLEDQYGSTRKTLKGIENQVTYAIGWNIVADFAIGVTVNNTNDVLQYNGGLYRTTETQPYTTDGATPDADTGDWVAVAEGELKTVERILNEPDGSAIYSTDYSTLLDDVEAIYDPSTQQIYNKPATVGAGERITDVTGDQLTTDAPAVYTMTLLDSISSLAQSIDDNTSDITTNAGNIDVNAGNITNNSIAITANSSAIAAISDFQSIASPVLFNADSMVLNTSSLYITNGYFAFITGVSAKGFTMSVETVSDTVDFAGSGTGTVWIARTTSNTWVFREDKPVFDVETGLYEGETEALSFITNPMVVISDVPRNFDYNISLATNTLGKTNFRNKAVSEISGSQHNNMMILINGELYTASGNSGGNPNSGTGRGLDATIRNYGVSSMTKVYFPETEARITKVGGNGRTGNYALFDNGNLYTWGLNTYGSLGLGDTTARGFPTLAATDVTDVFGKDTDGTNVATSGMFIKKTDGLIYATGYNVQGQLGLGTTTSVSSFIQVTSLGSDVEYIWNFAGANGVAVALKSDGTIWMTGYNGQGALGDGTTTNITSFTDLTADWGGSTIGDITKVVYSGDSTAKSMMILRDDSGTTAVYTCGDNGYGQIGNGTTTDVSTPYPVPGSSDLKSIGGIGSRARFMLTNDDDLYTWGYNGQGQLGIGSTTNATSPTLAESEVREVMSPDWDSNDNGYAVPFFIKKTDSYLYGTGENGQGQLGIGSSTDATSFTRVFFNEDVRYMGSFTTSNEARIVIAVTSDDKFFGWGYNAHYGVFDGSTGSNYLTPVLLRTPDV